VSRRRPTAQRRPPLLDRWIPGRPQEPAHGALEARAQILVLVVSIPDKAEELEHLEGVEAVEAVGETPHTATPPGDTSGLQVQEEVQVMGEPARARQARNNTSARPTMT